MSEDYLAENKIKRPETLWLMSAAILLTLAAGMLTGVVYETGSYPLGADVYGHLFKVKGLYQALLRGSSILSIPATGTAA